MLLGVEFIRRRRFYQIGGCSDSPHPTRRSSLCLYSSKHESLPSSSSSLARPDEKLGGAAGEAKERLDERLRAQKKSPNQRQNREEKLKCTEARPKAELHIEVYGSKKSSASRMFSWSKLGWKASDQDDCAVCLESFKVGETLIHLPCAHRFHSNCLEPWLQNNTHCPCCRMSIISQ